MADRYDPPQERGHKEQLYFGQQDGPQQELVWKWDGVKLYAGPFTLQPTEPSVTILAYPVLSI